MMGRGKHIWWQWAGLGLVPEVRADLSSWPWGRQGGTPCALATPCHGAAWPPNLPHPGRRDPWGWDLLAGSAPICPIQHLGLPQPHRLFPCCGAGWQHGDGVMGNCGGGVSPKILGRMDVNQSDGSECWTWLSSGCPPALHTMSPEHLWEQGLCLLPAAWEATTPSGGHQALAQPWAKTLAQLSSSLRQDPSQPSQTPGPVGNSKERGTGTPLFPFPDMALGTGRRLVPNVLQAGSHTRLHSSGTGQLKGEGANTVT